MTRPVGTFALVLHTHLPWLAHHGRWPVGEEWLHQAWAQSYAPLLEMLNRLGEQGHRDLLTIGVTPVLAAQLDDAYCLREHHRWLADWQLRADDLSGHRDPTLRQQGTDEARRARAALRRFEHQWASGGSPRWRALAESGVVELLGGPATHPVLPLVREPVADLALQTGLDDHVVRLGRRPTGIWLPECAYEPGLERVLSRHGVTHLMLDGPSLRGVGADTSRTWSLADSDVTVVGRDLDVTYRVWSPQRGYPGGSWYRDFHAYHHDSGFKLFRVTGAGVPSEQKAPYEPDRARAALDADVDDFVALVHRRLSEVAAAAGRPGLVVAAYDTELFGHWWHEGVDWLEAVLLRLPQAGIEVSSLATAISRMPAEAVVRPERSSWGLGKHLGVWEGPEVAGMLAQQRAAQDALLAAVAQRTSEPLARDPWLDELAEQVLLACASDWPFMVSHHSSADYARDRLDDHLQQVDRLVAAGRPSDVDATTRPFGHVDARLLTQVARGG
jgi:1,4-alpha-glucan branching enzyme